MTGTIPTDPAEREALAGEYVLGTLDARTVAAIEAALPGDAALRAAVDAWEARLAPLTALAAPEAPPEALWARIEAALDPAKPAARPSRLWRLWAIGATLAAAVFAGLAFLPRAPETRFMTVLVTDKSTPAWMAETDANGALRVSAVAALDGTKPRAPAGRALELWGLAPGASAPVSLGLLPANGGAVAIPATKFRPAAGMQILISVEPEGGAPHGSPTGPVVFFGRLSATGPDS